MVEKRRLMRAALGTALVSAAVSIAGKVTLPMTFQAHTVARAADVNADFAAVKSAVDDNDARLQALEARIAALEAASARPLRDCVGNSADDEMVRVGAACVDRFEASVWSSLDGGTQYGGAGDDYPAGFAKNGNTTTQLFARSKRNVQPSGSLTYFQASQACAAAGKRLLTSQEWQTAAAGTPESACNVQSYAIQPTGSSSCESLYGVFDMVGNVWEFVGDVLQGSTTPFNSGGTKANVLPAQYGGDALFGFNPALLPAGTYFPSTIVRGGAAWDWDLAGVFAASADNGLDYSNARIGFRCAR